MAMYSNSGTRNGGVNTLHTLQWKIENISHCYWLKMDEEIESPIFNTDALEGTKWSLVLCPMGGDYENYVAFFLRRQDVDGPEEIWLNYKLAFLDKDGSVLTEKYSCHPFLDKYVLGYHKFETRERVFFTDREKFLHEDALTVQITLWKKDEKILRLKHLHARTVFKLNRISFIWKIENYRTVKSCLRNKHKDFLIDFDLILSDKKVDIDVISVDDSIKYISFDTSIMGWNEKKTNLGISKYFPSDLKRGILSHIPVIPDHLIDKKKLYLDFECVYITETASNVFLDRNVISPKLTEELVKNKEKTCVGKALVLVDGLKSLYTDGIFSDVELRTQNKTFQAHKNILSVRSPVFKRMFSSDLKETNNGYVVITDIDDETVHRMLLYMYTDIIEDLQIEIACKLYSAADKYEIVSLMLECSSFLKDNLCPTKACDVLILADRHQDSDLKSAVQAYILDHDEVFDLKEWEHLMETNIKLAADIMYRKVKPGKISPKNG